MSVSPGYTSIGIIVNNGYNSKLVPVDKIRVRVPEFHGFDPSSSDSQSTSINNYTSDVSLPLANYQLAPGQTFADKYSVYKNGSLVYVTCPTGHTNDLLITGVYIDADSVEQNSIQTYLGEDYDKEVNLYTSGRTPVSGTNSGELIQKPYVPSLFYNNNSQWKSIFGIPTYETHITSKYGPRNGGFHQGIDIAWGPDCKNTAVVSVGDGTVVQVIKGYAPDSGGVPNTDGYGYGNTVVVCHGKKDDGHTYYTRYAHLNSIPNGTVDGVPEIKVGTHVVGSQNGNPNPTVIGYLGHTGNSTAAHLHFEILLDGIWWRTHNQAKDARGGRAVNPQNYITPERYNS